MITADERNMIKVKKLTLESKIAKLLTEFEQETETIVEHINIDRRPLISLSPQDLINIKTEVSFGKL